MLVHIFGKACICRYKLVVEGEGEGSDKGNRRLAILRPFKSISVISGRWEVIMNGCFQMDPVNV